MWRLFVLKCVGIEMCNMSWWISFICIFIFCSLDIISGQECGSDFTDPRGTIETLHPYKAKSDCKWCIFGAPTETIALRFEEFQTESDDHCQYDYVQVYDGDNTNSAEFKGPFCGSPLPPDIRSSSNVMCVTFKSDDSDQFSGFRAQYTTLNYSAASPCRWNWNSFNGSCYKFVGSFVPGKTWDQARNYCQRLGADLASIGSDEENSYIRTYILNASAGKNFNLWIGLNDPDREGAFEWSDGSANFYNNWKKGKPNKEYKQDNCVEMMVGSGTWNNAPCSIEKRFVCKLTRDWCDWGWNLFYGSCYKPFGLKKNWSQARDYCQEVGTDLVSIHSNEENSHIQTDLIKDTWIDPNRHWIGLNDRDSEGAFEWSDGSVNVYSNWYKEEPNNGAGGGEDCVEILVGTSGTWNDDTCSEQKKFVCEIKQDINECVSDPCHNGGTCNDGINGYTCTCTAGWGGITCTVNINECVSDPCHNGGTCNDGINGYTCTCTAGWGGITCTVKIEHEDNDNSTTYIIVIAILAVVTVAVWVAILTWKCRKLCGGQNDHYAHATPRSQIQQPVYDVVDNPGTSNDTNMRVVSEHTYDNAVFSSANKE